MQPTHTTNGTQVARLIENAQGTALIGTLDGQCTGLHHWDTQGRLLDGYRLQPICADHPLNLAMEAAG